MRRWGITPTLSYTGVLQTNATGGPHQVWSYAGQLSAGLDLDLEKSLKVRGMSIYIGASWGTGSDLSGFLHTLFPVNSIYAPTYYLGEMYLQQTLLNKKLTLAGGRLGAANTFAILPVFANYVNYGINPNPYSLGANDIGFFSPPAGTEWGALALYDVTPLIQVSAGLFNTNPNSANGADHGTDFALQQGNKGALVVGQISFFPHQIKKDEGRQGEYSLGFITDNNSFADLSGGKTNSGGYWGVFAQGQEMVYQPDGPGTSRGLTVWASWAYNSKPVISPIPLFWGAGASYEGLIPARKKDVISAGWIYGRVSSSIPATTAEQVFELNYSLRFGRVLAITPDFQYIWNPGGYSVLEPLSQAFRRRSRSETGPGDRCRLAINGRRQGGENRWEKSVMQRFGKWRRGRCFARPICQIDVVGHGNFSCIFRVQTLKTKGLSGRFRANI